MDWSLSDIRKGQHSDSRRGGRAGLTPEKGSEGMGVPQKPTGGPSSPLHPCALPRQTAQALEDMLQALVMDGLNPNMVILQEVLEVSDHRGRGPRDPVTFWDMRTQDSSPGAV